MSSIIHKKVYLEFIKLLTDFETQLNSSDKSINQESWSNVQQFFQQKLLPLTDDELTELTVQQWRSLQTEIQREFRLLNTDILFLGASRQAATKELRLKSISDRIMRLIKYVNRAKELVAD